MRSLIDNNRNYLVSDDDWWGKIKVFLGVVGVVAVFIVIFNIINGATNAGPLGDDSDNQNEEIAITTTPDYTPQTKPEEESLQSVPSSLPGNVPENYYVTKIVDGDTIYVSGIDTRIRLIGINTPETVKSSTPVQCYGPESSSFLSNLILGKYVGLESDYSAGDRDQYGRPLRYVYFNGENVNYKIIYEGYGYEASYGSDYKYSDDFIKAENDASANGRGLWSPTTCNGQL